MFERLKEIGLTEREIKVYSALVRHGRQTITGLSKSASINRSYSYEILDRLSKKGFISRVIVNNKNYWQALPYKKVISYIEELKKDIEISLKQAERSAKKEEDTQINIFKGRKSVKIVCDSIATSKTKVIGFGAEGQIRKFFPYSYKHIIRKIEDSGTRFELITLKDKIPLTKHQTKYRSFKKNFPSCVEINVYEDRTILFLWKDDPQVIEIKDEDIANSFRNYHNILWNIN